MVWYDAYRTYDDDTLATLANAGIVRRAAKDVESGKIGWLEQREDGGVVAADGQHVQLDARGPQHARCDCPAPGMCKHIIAAAQWLRTLTSANIGVTEREADTASGAPSPDPIAAILALQAPALFKAAGVAAVRRAAATPAGGVEWHVHGSNLVIELPELGVSCRWVSGAGFAGMVSELPTNERKALHLIAITAVREALGAPFSWPEGMSTQAPDKTTALGEPERVFLSQVDSTVQELLTGGLAHVSELTSARLLALNMSARGEGLPRLAALLRNLGGTIDLLVRRDHRAEERDALMLMARIHALCTALREAGGDLVASLRGQLRRDFEEETASLDLLPVGAHWWQTRGGARGLTLAFWQPDKARLLQATLARPDASDTSFTRNSAWATHALWSGAGTPEHVCGKAVELTQPRLAEDGRLALGGVTRAQTSPMWKSNDARLASLGCANWLELTDRLGGAASLIDDPTDLFLLRPSTTQAPVLDEVRQRLDWWVADVQGRRMRLTIPVDVAQQARLDNLDRIHARRAAIHAILVRVERSGASTELVPVAVLSETPEKVLSVLSLDFVTEPIRKSSLANRILRLFEARRQQTQAPSTDESTLPRRLVGPVLDVLETQAATGRMPLTETQTQQLREGLQRVRAVGLDAVDSALTEHLNNPSPSHLLRLAFVSFLAIELGGLSLQE
jgi:hypothetical protein